MTTNNTVTTRYRRAAVIGTACVLLGAAVGIFAGGAGRNIVTPINEVTFSKPGALGTSMASAAALWSDPATGRSSALVKFTKGSTEKHFHTFDYQLVVVKGPVTHWTDGLPEAGSKRLEAGSYWYQPAGSVHQDTCLVDECMLFVDNFSKGETKIVK